VKQCLKDESYPMLRASILESSGSEVLEFISCHVDLGSDQVRVFRTNDRFNVDSIDYPVQAVINLERINNIRRINKFHEAVNGKLANNGVYVGCAETQDQRKKRILTKFPRLIARPFLFIDFLYKRALPKLPIIKSPYFAITAGHNRVMSKAEILGRLVSCGFEIVETREINNLLYSVTRKAKEPEFDYEASYGPIFKMKRVGKGGEIVKFYKFRTMHPYAEHLQNSIIGENKLDENGKINNDYRVATWGKFLRKYWIDELPMTFNFLKGDLKFFGVRPLSADYFSRYPSKLQKLRIRTKPGLIPPFYVDLPNSFDEIISSEKKYLDEYFQSPIITDLRYLGKALWNIVIKGKRSA